MTNEDQVCCPKFNPEKWDKKTFTWNNRPFIMESMRTFFHIPCPPVMTKKITGLCKLADESKKTEPVKEDMLLLFRDPSAFKSEIYLSVTGQVPNANNTTISGTFIARTFSGPYNAVPKFMKQMNEYLTAENKKATDYYIHYAYCPKCAEKYGGENYMIIFAKI